MYLLVCIAFLGCTKSIDIEYGEPIPKEVDNNSLVGVWDGTINCPGCEDKVYRYKLTIEKHENNTASGKLKIHKIPNQQYYILFDVAININNNSLEVSTTNVIEEIDVSSITYWCKENVYNLEVSADRTKLNGKWISSGNCSNVIGNTNNIELTKQ